MHVYFDLDFGQVQVFEDAGMDLRNELLDIVKSVGEDFEDVEKMGKANLATK